MTISREGEVRAGKGKCPLGKHGVGEAVDQSVGEGEKGEVSGGKVWEREVWTI